MRTRRCFATAIADNALGGQFVLRIVESATTGNEHVASITNSIIAQPGKTSLDLGGAADQTLIRYVLASEIASLRAGASGGTVFIGNPAFENPTLGDYRPRDNAIAVDYAPAVFPDGPARSTASCSTSCAIRVRWTCRR